MVVYDGPTLRSLRKSRGIPLRRFARAARISHGHLSKVERGEYGRPVTPAILRAYQSLLGTLTNPHPGDLPPDACRRFVARVASVAVGGEITDGSMALSDSARLTRLLDYQCRLPQPESLDHTLAVLAQHIDALDGATAGLIAHAVLRWAVRSLQPSDAHYAAIAQLALRAGRTGFDLGCHHQARELLVIALFAAVTAADLDLRARVLATIAAHLGDADHAEDGHTILRLAGCDERISPDTRALLDQIGQQWRG